MNREKRKMFWYYGMVITVSAVVLLAGSLVAYRLRDRPIQRLLRPESGQEAREEKLVADDGEKKTPVTVSVAARERTEAELEVLFEEAEKEIEQKLKGDNETLSCVRKALYMPVSLQNGQVVVSWSCDQPEYVSYDGTLGENIPKNGITVCLEASLECQRQVRWYKKNVTVCPPEDEDGLSEVLLEADQVKTEQYYELPRSLGGRELRWYRQQTNPAPLLAVLILLIGVFLPLRKQEAMIRQKKQYRECLLREYPRLVSQLTLYLGAGMSLPQAFSSMADTDRKGSQDILQKECALLVREMDRGIPAGEAIQRFGDRSGLWEYRAFCGMLLQNRQKGNDKLLTMLQNEAEKAFAERQRRARITGNEAGTKLLMPMAMMLVVVLMIVLFPAVVSFYA